MIVIVVFDYLPTLGGTTTQARLHGREFIRSGESVTVVTRRIIGLPKFETVGQVKVRRIGLRGAGQLGKMAYLGGLWLWLRRQHRAIHGVSVLLDCDFAIAAAMAGVGDKTVMTWVGRADIARQLTGLPGRIRRWWLRRMTQVALSPRMQDILRTYDLDSVIIPVPVDTQDFHLPTRDERLDARLALGLTAERVVLFVGHLRPAKGVHLLLEAFVYLTAGYPSLRLFLVGGANEATEGSYLCQLRTLIAQSALQDRVTIWGPQPDVLRFLHSADIFCLPSFVEGMSNALLEAMACGLICVAPPCAGGDELLADGAGLIPESNEPRALAQAIAAVLSDWNSYQLRRTSASKVTQSQHSPFDVAAAYLRIWDR